jgi:hypothetical protein
MLQQGSERKVGLDEWKMFRSRGYRGLQLRSLLRRVELCEEFRDGGSRDSE